MRTLEGGEHDVDPAATSPARADVESGAFETPTTTASGTPHVRVLDGFRAFAILGVVVLHLLLLSGVLEATRGTNTGVFLWATFGNNIDAFFIISGFVLFLPTVARRGDFGEIRRFAIGRATRIVPAYWLVMVLALVAAIIITGRVPAVTSIVANFTFLQLPWGIFDSDVTAGFAVNVPVWMLSVVVGFYFVLPLVARAYYRHPLIGLAIAAAITLGWKEFVVREGAFLASLSDRVRPDYLASAVSVDQLPGWAFSIGLGMTGAWAYMWLVERFPRERLARIALLAVPAVVAGHVVGAYLFGDASRDASTLLTGATARLDGPETMFSTVFRGAVIAVVLLGPLWMQRPFANRVTDRLASLSYGVYLLHFLVIFCLISAFPFPKDGTFGAFALLAVVALPLTFLGAAVSRRYFEQPVQRWGRARWLDGRRRGTRQDRGPLLSEHP